MSAPRRLTLAHLREANSFSPVGWRPPANTLRQVVGAIREFLKDPATGPADRVMLVNLAAKLARSNLAKLG
jgi:hypothetical protein